MGGRHDWGKRAYHQLRKTLSLNTKGTKLTKATKTNETDGSPFGPVGLVRLRGLRGLRALRTKPGSCDQRSGAPKLRLEETASVLRADEPLPRTRAKDGDLGP